jgi:hypothetical protein
LVCLLASVVFANSKSPVESLPGLVKPFDHQSG